MHTIDAHHHLWDLDVRDQEWITGPQLTPLRRSFTLKDYETQARPTGITASVLVQTVAVTEETPELLSLAAGSDLIGAVVGWTDLTSPAISDELARLRGLPGGEFLRGIRHQVQSEPDPRWLTRPDVLRGLRAVAAAGLVYDVLVLPHQLPSAIQAAAAVPELTFVLDHLGKPPIASHTIEPWSAGLRRFSALPNTVCKLSGMVTEADWASWTLDDLRPYADSALEAFGPHRLMFGSDWPVCTLAASCTDVVAYTQALTSALGETEQSAVWSGTAARTYRMPADQPLR
ncbi:amidohydrolase family protein [Streptomyces sioyaensis]|uniref:amidohydrolase family protein n=1 Tax=Streptomyces sioyaensis TaxID=67364 RepID=UPI00379F2CBD